MGKYNGPSIIDGGQNIKFPSHLNYGAFVLENILKNKEKIALCNGETGEQITYGEMAQKIVNLASSLMRIGVQQDDVISICSENRMEYIITAIAALYIGAVVTFINYSYSNDEIIHTLGISKPNYMFLSTTAYNKYYKTIENLKLIKEFYIFDDTHNFKSYKELLIPHVNIELFPIIKLNGTEKTALILYSSGTTGLPKGAKLSHCNLIISGLQPSLFDRERVCFSIAPWSNTVGIVLAMRAIAKTQTIIYLKRFQEEIYLKCIDKYKVQMLLTVPPLVFLLNKSKLLKQFDLSSVEIVYCGGAPLGNTVIDECKKTFPKLKHVLQGYGMTEASGVVTEESEEENRTGSVGKPVLGNIVKIVDPETQRMLGPYQTGELRLKGPVIFQGYIGKDLKDEIDEEGYYKTGDIGYYDEDGHFFIVDRIKEIIKYKAGQVAPSELETLLRQHPGVKDVGVVGTPDPLAGELPTAFVVKMPNVNVTEKELIDYVAAKVSSWKQLRGGIKFIDEIPKLASGKILRRKLRELLAKPIVSKL